jgi:hypothetical protein
MGLSRVLVAVGVGIVALIVAVVIWHGRNYSFPASRVWPTGDTVTVEVPSKASDGTSWSVSVVPGSSPETDEYHLHIRHWWASTSLLPGQQVRIERRMYTYVRPVVTRVQRDALNREVTIKVELRKAD